MSTNEHEHGDGVDLPIPTPWPIITALGVTLLLAGLVLTLVISLAGIIIGLVGAVGWFLDVFPVPKHELVPLVEADRRPAPVKISPRRISHLHYGHQSHRVRIPMEVHRNSAGVIGGIAGGIAMAVMAMLYGLFAQHSIWYPINMMAASGIPRLAEANLATLRQFDAQGLIVAILAHGAFSILVGLLYTVLLPMLPARFEWLFGGILTPLMWTAVLYPAFQLINPALAARVDWPWFILCQISFGLVGGYVIFKSQKVETMQSWSMADRLGVHGIHGDEDK